jgi:cardiolipin synthase
MKGLDMDTHLPLLTELDYRTTLLLTIAYLLIQLAMAFHILLHKKEEASSAVLWLVSIFTIPFLGIFLYLIFGVNRIKSTGRRTRLANDLIHTAKNAPIHAAMKNYLEEQRRYIPDENSDYRCSLSFNRVLDRLINDTYPIKGNNLTMLKDGNMAYPQMLEAIKKAESSIHLQSFIIMNDTLGHLIFDTLEAKARAGVQVRVLYDRFGSASAVLAHFFRKYAKNIPNFELMPFSAPNLFAPWRIQLRNHRKLMVVDGKVAFIGGINISSDNITPDDLEYGAVQSKYIHDLHCKIEGPAVGEFQFSFLRDWCYAGNLSPSKVLTEKYFPLNESQGNSVVRVISSGPGHHYEATQKVFFTAAATAQKYLWIITPYFVPEKAFVTALCMAVGRGVDVRVILPRNNNHKFVFFASQSLYEELLSNGVRIFEKKGMFSHAKSMMIDGEWAYMGSSNCDVRSFRLNYELDFVVSKGDFLDDLHEQFLEEQVGTDEIFLEDVLGKNIFIQLVENLCSLLIPIL